VFTVIAFRLLEARGRVRGRGVRLPRGKIAAKVWLERVSNIDDLDSPPPPPLGFKAFGGYWNATEIFLKHALDYYRARNEAGLTLLKHAKDNLPEELHS